MEQDITQSELNEMATNMKEVADGYDDAMAAIRARGLAVEVVSPQEAIDYLADRVATLQGDTVDGPADSVGVRRCHRDVVQSAGQHPPRMTRSQGEVGP